MSAVYAIMCTIHTPHDTHRYKITKLGKPSATTVLLINLNADWLCNSYCYTNTAHHMFHECVDSHRLTCPGDHSNCYQTSRQQWILTVKGSGDSPGEVPIWIHAHTYHNLVHRTLHTPQYVVVPYTLLSGLQSLTSQPLRTTLTCYSLRKLLVPVTVLWQVKLHTNTIHTQTDNIPTELFIHRTSKHTMQVVVTTWHQNKNFIYPKLKHF